MELSSKLKVVFFALLRQEICGEELSSDIKNLIDEDLLENLFAIAKRQGLSHLIFDALVKNEITGSKGLFSKLKNEKNVAIFRSNQIDFELKQISKALEEEKIDFIFLKGAIIRNLYPEKWMRTSCDIDLLIKEQDLERAIEVLQKSLDYKSVEKTEQDVQFLSQSGLTIELHFSLYRGEENEYAKLLNCAWDNVVEAQTNRKILTNEFFYLYHIVHMALHFKQGGCGIRPFIDLYLIKKNVNVQRETVAEYLEEIGLLTFENHIFRASKFILGEIESNNIINSIIDFVLGSEMYGDIKNRALINQAKKGGKKKFILSRIFISYSELLEQYPKLKKFKILYPYYSVKRWLRLLFGKDSKRVRREIKVINSTTEEENKKIKELLNNLKI